MALETHALGSYRVFGWSDLLNLTSSVDAQKVFIMMPVLLHLLQGTIFL